MGGLLSLWMNFSHVTNKFLTACSFLNVFWLGLGLGEILITDFKDNKISRLNEKQDTFHKVFMYSMLTEH